MSNATSMTLSTSRQALTNSCFKRVREEINNHNGSLGFDQYMEIVLHDPLEGYYRYKHEIFGSEGDFTTVPETSTHLAYCLAHACAMLIHDDIKRDILEIGAGSGILACNIISYLKTWDQLPNHYYIFEPSAPLRAKQKKLFEKEIPDSLSIIEWLPDLSCTIETAIIIANEVLDALPVKCFQVKNKSVHERCVTLKDEGSLIWTLRNPTEKLDAAFDCLTVMLNEPLEDDYCSEVNLNIQDTLYKWSDCCSQCIMFLIDYGFPQTEYYHPQRNMGTLRCYFKHQFSEDPFANPGLQDITTDVDFTAVAQAAALLKIGVLSFGSQRNFMLANNLLDWRPSGQDEMERIAQIAQLKQLTLGSAISERFQVMVLGKGIDYGADRFTLRDMRIRL